MTLNFHDYYVMGEKLGEGQHASVYKCFKRKNPRSSEETTPLPSFKLDKSQYDNQQTFAVKLVRADDQEKLQAHIKEFDILKNLYHTNVVHGIEVFRNEFKNEVF